MMTTEKPNYPGSLQGTSAFELSLTYMAFYWSTSSLPELRDFSSAERERIFQAALRTLPISFWGGLLVISFMFGASAIGIMVAITFGEILAVLILELPILLLCRAMLLNLARPRIQQLARDNNCDDL
jgi:hypothetical protein